MKIRKAQIKDLDILEKISKEQFEFDSLRPKFKYLINNNNPSTLINLGKINIFTYIFRLFFSFIYI